MTMMRFSLALFFLVFGCSDAFVSHTQSSQRRLGPLQATLEGLKAGIVGGGPSGLLLAHYLLQAGASSVDILERRSRSTDLENRAYALGVGMRGRTGIRGIDEKLWQAVKARGYGSERFTLYIGGGFSVRLRDGSGGDDGMEPSVLMYQSDLCDALLDELEERYSKDDSFSIQFDQQVSECNLESKTISTESSKVHGPFDLIVGCDGVNSPVRSAMETSFPGAIQVEKKSLPGNFKVCRLPNAPPKVDPTSVALLLPKAGSVTAFVEPTADGSCILFAGRSETDDDPVLNPSSNLTATVEALETRFPLLEGCDFQDMAKQLSTQKGGAASSVKCNVYHCEGTALVGDAAHATGGVSGQGVNSALLDSKALAECLLEHFDKDNKKASLETSLLKYSQRQVPEGLALYDLSFGPKPTGLPLKLRFALKNAVSAIFRGRFGIGKPPLQTLLTTTMQPFAEIRRDLGVYYDEEFPSQEEFDRQLSLTSEQMVFKQPVESS